MNSDHELGRLAVEILDALPERVVRYRRSDLTIVYCNTAWAAANGREPGDVVGRSLLEFLSDDGQKGLDRQLARLGPDAPVLPDDVPRADLAVPGHWVAWVDRLLPTDDVIAVGRDVTEQHMLLAELESREARFRALADNSSDVVFRVVLEPSPHFDYMSPSVERMTGYPNSIFLADIGRFAATLDDDSLVLMERAISGKPMPDRFDLRGVRADGSVQVTEVHLTSFPGGLQGIGIDVTEMRSTVDDLAERAMHDPLTGLANRRLFEQLIEVSVARAVRQSTPLALLFIDLDRFKTVNDVYGHAAGDIVLQEVASRLLSVARRADVVARIGGDEFVVLYEPGDRASDHLGARIEAALSEPIRVSATTEVTCGASVGYSDIRQCGANATRMVEAADAAMYAIKKIRHET